MSQSDVIWAALIAAGVAFETYALANGKSGDTLSEAPRRWVRVRTSGVGRYGFLAAWAGFGVWFAGHIAEWWA